MGIGSREDYLGSLGRVADALGLDVISVQYDRVELAVLAHNSMYRVVVEPLETGDVVDGRALAVIFDRSGREVPA